MSNPAWLRLPRAIAASVSLDTAPFGVLWVDYQGSIGYANPGVGGLLGWESGEAIGHDISELSHSWNIADWQNILWPKTSPGPGFSVESLWRRQGGGTRALMACLARLQVAGHEIVSIYLSAVSEEANRKVPVRDNYPGFFNDLLTGIGFVDETLAVKQFNPALGAILGLDQSAVIGHPIATLLAPANGQESRWHEMPSLGFKDWMFQFRNAKGRHFHLIASAYLDKNGHDGEFNHVVTVEDVSEREQLKRRLDQHEHSFENLAENTPGMIYKFVLSTDGHTSFPYVSPGSREIWEIDPALVRDDATPILNLIHPEDIGAFQESVMKSASELSPWEFEGRMIAPSGKIKWFHAASRPELTDQGDIVWQGLLMDITHQKRIEEELKAAKLKAESAAQSKANFLANMSHEIRTPMNGVIGMAELLAQTALESRQKYYVETIRSSAEVLLTIINDILDLSKIEAGKLLLHPAVFDLRRTLEDVATLLAPRAFERGLEVIVRYDPRAPSQVVGDAVRIRQVLTNLIGNAIKFTHAGHVLIEVVELDREGENAHLGFSVSDTGIGISPEALRRIFDKFEQADASTSRKYEGSGLGLTISRQIVEMMGGTLMAESELNRGSLFRFQLSLPVRDQSPGRDVVVADLSGFWILAVDDHPVNRELLSDVFDDWGVYHREVASGPEALNELRRAAAEGRPYDVAILDYHMPGMDGLFLAAAIRAEPEICGITEIILSSSSFTEEQQRRMAEAGVVAQLLKPLRTFQLRQTLINLLENKPRAGVLAGPPRVGKAPEPVVAAPPSRDIRVSSCEGLRVLLAEDNEVNIEIASDMLKNLGFAVDCAVNGLEAVTLAKQQSYDLIFMDCQMPEMDGFEATRQIRQQVAPSPIIIAMTAYAMAGDKERCLAAGMDDYLPKPVTFANLTEVSSKYTQVIRERHAAAALKQADKETGAAIGETPAAVYRPVELQPRRSPLFDLEAGLRVTGGKMEVLRRAIDIWWKKLPTWLAELKDGIQQKDVQHIGRIAHTLRGAASNIGALSIACYAERIEQEAQRDTVDEVVNLYECLVLDVERLRHVTRNLDANGHLGA
jgi:two-component system sensor histidine kinase/response regulator